MLPNMMDGIVERRVREAECHAATTTQQMMEDQQGRDNLATAGQTGGRRPRSSANKDVIAAGKGVVNLAGHSGGILQRLSKHAPGNGPLTLMRNTSSMASYAAAAGLNVKCVPVFTLHLSLHCASHWVTTRAWFWEALLLHAGSWISWPVCILVSCLHSLWHCCRCCSVCGFISLASKGHTMVLGRHAIASASY
jgi:hypothetical protein